MNDNLAGLPIASQIRLLREDRGFSLAELAARSGTSAPTVHRYESGWDRFELRTLERIGAALGAGVEVRFVPGRESPVDRPAPRGLVRLLAPLFWDTRLDRSHLEAFPDWVLARVLTYGTLDQVRAARAFFGDEAVARASRRRGVDARTRAYWELVLEEPCTPRS